MNKLILGSILLVFLATAAYFLVSRNSQGGLSNSDWVSVNDPNLTDSEKRFVENTQRIEKGAADRIEKRLIEEFKTASQKSVPDVGDFFPFEKIQDQEFQKVNFKGRYNVIVFGAGLTSGTSGSEKIANKFQKYIENSLLNVIRITTSGDLPEKKMVNIVIDARKPSDKLYPSSSSGKAADWIGLPRSPAAYIVSSDGKVIYARFSGDYSNEDQLPKYLKLSLIDGNEINLEKQTLKLGQKIDFSIANFVPSEILDKYLNSKSGVSVLIFSQPECNLCEGVKNYLKESTQKWQKEGHGVLIINSDPAIKLSYEESNGALKISDQERKIQNYFKIEQFPMVVFLQNKQYYGSISYSAYEKMTGFTKFDSINNDPERRKTKQEIDNTPFSKAIDHAIDSVR